MLSDQLQLIKTEAGDLRAIADFACRENNDSHISEQYLRWWYFQNPSNSFSFRHCSFEDEIVGMATTNNFQIQTAAGVKTAAMPQKVLTSAAMRGKGLFGKLYWQTEKDNLEGGVDYFLTITNEMSTPIFLKKFGYLRGLCPDVITMLPNVTGFIKAKNYESVAPDSIINSEEPRNSAFIKSAEHFRWRYSPDSQNESVVLKVKGNDETTAGFVFLKKIYKKRLPLYVLLDLLVLQAPQIERLLAEAVKYASRKLSLGLLALDREDLSPYWQKFAHRRVKNRFNFLVKGRDAGETKRLAETKFNFTFGDLDFI